MDDGSAGTVLYVVYVRYSTILYLRATTTVRGSVLCILVVTKGTCIRYHCGKSRMSVSMMIRSLLFLHYSRSTLCSRKEIWKASYSSKAVS